VVDTETTGVYPSDRIVEIACVTVDLDGRIVDEFDTLVDPQRDVGPTWIHGVTATMLSGAPTFEQVAGLVASRLHGAVLAAHNMPFDARMLASEYARVGVDLDLRHGLDTLAATGCKLGDACAQHGITLTGAHTALEDARATAHLLLAVAARIRPNGTRPAMFPSGLPLEGPTKRRSTDAVVVAPAPYLARLTAQLHHPERDANVAAYLDLLDRAMADLHLDRDEQAGLAGLAQDLGLSTSQIGDAHRRWLIELIGVACEDGVVDAEEYDQLCRAAAALGIEQKLVDERTETYRTARAEVTLDAGMTVCFTGVPVDRRGREIPRDHLQDHARRLGLQPVDSVTKSRCDLLVAADPNTRSGKAAKARRYNIPVIGADDFLRAAPGTSLSGWATEVTRRETLQCGGCGRFWTRSASRGRQPDLCADCAARADESAVRERTTVRPAPPRDPTPTGVVGAELVVSIDAEAGTETLRCTSCGRHWNRQRTRGRKPHTCPDC